MVRSSPLPRTSRFDLRFSSGGNVGRKADRLSTLEGSQRAMPRASASTELCRPTGRFEAASRRYQVAISVPHRTPLNHSTEDRAIDVAPRERYILFDGDSAE